MEDEYACFGKSVDYKEVAKGFSSQALSVVRTVIERCRKEYEQNALQVPIECFESRASFYTSYPPEVISELKDYRDKGDTKTSNFDVDERIKVLRILQNLYLQEKGPTYADVYDQQSLVQNDFYQFRKDLYNFGFYYTPTKTRYILVENPKLRFERCHFLNKIKKFRNEGRQICYIDGREVNSKHLYEKPNVTNTEQQLGKEAFILLHAICGKDIINHLFSNVISKELLKKWIFDVVLKVVTPGCVFVMESNPFYGELVTNEITRYHKKEEMLKCLRLNNVPCSDEMNKAELYELAQKLVRKEKYYDIDRLLNALGHEVLRLPFGCKNLSMTELLWNHICTPSFVKITPTVIKDNLIADLNRLVSEKGNEFVNKIINWENELLSLDVMTEKVLDKSFQFDVDKIIANSPED